MYHIKHNGSFLCSNGKTNDKRSKKESFISFGAAHLSTLTACCPECKKKYDEFLAKDIKI